MHGVRCLLGDGHVGPTPGSGAVDGLRATDACLTLRALYQTPMQPASMIGRLATAGARPRDRASLLRELEATAAFRSALRQDLHKTEAAAAAAGLTPRRYDLLLMIEAANRAQAPASVSMLCRRLALKQSTVSELVKGAESAGLVRRARSVSDGRVTQLELTDDGAARLLRVFDALRDDRAAFVETFGVLGNPG